jgi:hypothetical protein
MSDAVATTSAPAPSAPATSADADSVSVGARSHQPPSRGARSARETGEAPARRDPTAPPKRREPPPPRTRDKAETPLTEEFRKGLEAKADDATGEESPAVEAVEEALEAKTGEEAEKPGEEAKPVDEAVKVEVEKFKTQIAEKTQAVLREHAAMTRKVEWLMQAIEEAGLEIDPQALELFDLKTEKELGADFAKKQAEQTEAQRKAEHDKAVAAEVSKINGQISAKAKEAKIPEADLKARWAVMVRLWQQQGGKGDEPTLDDAVFEIQAVSNARQVKASTSAPALVKSKGPTSAVKPRYENTHDGWRRHLRSQGFAD